MNTLILSKAIFDDNRLVSVRTITYKFDQQPELYQDMLAMTGGYSTLINLLKENVGHMFELAISASLERPNNEIMVEDCSTIKQRIGKTGIDFSLNKDYKVIVVE